MSMDGILCPDAIKQLKGFWQGMRWEDVPIPHSFHKQTDNRDEGKEVKMLRTQNK